MHEALSTVGGGVLPVNAVLFMGTSHTTDVHTLFHLPKFPESNKVNQSLTNEGVSEDEATPQIRDDAIVLENPSSLVLPVSVVLDWYLHDPYRGPIPKGEVITGVLKIDKGRFLVKLLLKHAGPISLRCWLHLVISMVLGFLGKSP